MTTRREKPLTEKLSEWSMAYRAVLEEINPNDGWEEQPTATPGFSIRSRDSGGALNARRTAALVAAMLVGQGVRGLQSEAPRGLAGETRVPVEELEDES